MSLSSRLNEYDETRSCHMAREGERSNFVGFVSSILVGDREYVPRRSRGSGNVSDVWRFAECVTGGVDRMGGLRFDNGECVERGYAALLLADQIKALASGIDSTP